MITNEDVILNVDFEQKDEVKALGAKWNSSIKKWFIPKGKDTSPFEQYLNLPEKTKVYTGDKGKAGIGGLFVDLIPSTAWYKNLRSMFTDDMWKLIRTAVYKRDGYKCKVCQGKGPKHPVEAHERWEYDLHNRLQILTDIVSLCPSCHLSTHYGFASIQGRSSEAFERLKYVNGWDDEQTNEHIHEAFEIWEQLNNYRWDLSKDDIVIVLDKLGIQIYEDDLNKGDNETYDNDWYFDDH